MKNNLLNRVIISVSIFGILVCIMLLFPQTREFLIDIGARIREKDLSNDYWHRILFQSAAWILSVFLFILIILCYPPTQQKIKKILEINKHEIVFYFIFLLFLSALCRLLFINMSSISLYTTWGLSEFLTNYQGGFVRRGLIGEILLFFANNFNINVELTIKIFCFLCFSIVCVFFVKCFLLNGYSLYILPLCFFLGGGILFNNWVGKDYMLICFFIFILWLYNSSFQKILKILLINILLVFCILSHEVIAFFSLPVLFFTFFNEYKSKGFMKSLVLSFIYLIPSIFALLLVMFMHGNSQTAQMIWTSWANVIDIDISEIRGAVGAIGWTKEFAIKFHIRGIFLATSYGISSLIVWLISFPVIYYIATNALFIFRKKENNFLDRQKTILSLLLIFQFLCLLPMFALVFYDYLRAIFFWTVSSFAIFLLIPLEKLENIFPKIFLSKVGHINNLITKIVRPSKTNIAFLMVFIGISPYGFYLDAAFRMTIIYNVLMFISELINPIRQFLLLLFEL